jgi:conjugal transfer pilus assembly protein TraF
MALSIQAFAVDDVTRGWHWYEETEEKKQEQPEQKIQEPKTVKEVIKPPETKPEEKEEKKEEFNTSVDNFKFPLTDEAKSIPVLKEWLENPTEENAKKWLAWQAKYFEHNEKIARSLRNAYLNYGDQIYRLEGMPEQPIASAIASRKQTEVYQQVFNSVSDKIGIFFFYKKGCEYCEAEIRPLKIFADKYNFKVIGVVASPEDKIEGLPFETKVAPGVFYKYKITSVPTISAFYAKENDMQIIAKGYTPTSQIELNLKAYLLQKGLITKDEFISLWRAEDTEILKELIEGENNKPVSLIEATNVGE